MAPRKQDVDTGELKGNDKAGTLEETVDRVKSGVDLVDRVDLTKDALELEKFMNDVLTIQISPSENPEVNPIDLPSVNGVNQPIVLGATMKVRRKYVEVMARTTSINYTQETPNPMEPERKVMREQRVLSRPFAVVHDPAGADGARWLQAIMAQE